MTATKRPLRMAEKAHSRHLEVRTAWPQLPGRSARRSMLDGESAARQQSSKWPAASGLLLAGGPERNDPLAASTSGTGELIDKALDAGAKRIIVCLGGSATTDGGLGALNAIRTVHRLRGVQLLVACDVTTLFVDAAAVFGPQRERAQPRLRCSQGASNAWRSSISRTTESMCARFPAAALPEASPER